MYLVRVHVMAGKLSTAATEENDAIYRKNIKYAAEILKSENLLCLIEPINNYAVPNYYLNSYDKGKRHRRLEHFLQFSFQQLMLSMTLTCQI